MFSTIRLWIYGAFAGLVTFFGVWLYRRGGKDAAHDMVEDDYENAEDIRRRVSVDRDKRVRELDDAGWRDE